MDELLDRIDDKDRLKKKDMPEWIKPMLARLTKERFSDEEWIYERKLDGERILAYCHGKKVSLMTRNRKSADASYPEIKKALKKSVKKDMILDGEVVSFSGNITDFSKLQPRMHVSDPKEARKKGISVYYYLFDILHYDGYDTAGLMLRDRKSLLRDAISYEDPIRFLPHRNRDGKKYFRKACSKGWEGLIAKDAKSEYKHSRSGKWLKFKCVEQQEMVIGGFTDPEGEREGFGALLLGYYDGGGLVYAGKVGTGFDDKTLSGLRSRMDEIEKDDSPYDKGEPPDDAHFVLPKLVCEIAFTEWTDDNKLRHPRYKGLRRDKKAKDVGKEA